MTSEVLAEWKGRLNSLKVLPFDGSASAPKYEMTWIGNLAGRINGLEIGTDYWAASADGTGVSDYYGVITTSEGETALVEGARNHHACGTRAHPQPVRD
jgi:hypothetical protein